MLVYEPVFLVLLIALAIDAAVGWPATLFKRIGHPVTWMGALISGLDRSLNDQSMTRSRLRFNGAVAVGLLIAVVGGLAMAVQIVVVFLLPVWMAVAVLGLITASLVAQKSLYEHVAAVADGLERGGLQGGREAVAMVVGRDPKTLDEAGVGRAAIESLAENFSDGVVAPVFWAVVCGLPGIAVYKAISTADSMIGHRSPRYEAFGWAAARLDDLVNLPASRLTAGLIVLAALLRGRSARNAASSVMRDAAHHRSPNAGWPEAAMAGGLGLALGGPRTYDGVRVEDVWMGNGRREVGAADIRAALSLYVTGCFLVAGSIGVLALA